MSGQIGNCSNNHSRVVVLTSHTCGFQINDQKNISHFYIIWNKQLNHQMPPHIQRQHKIFTVMTRFNVILMSDLNYIRFKPQ